VFLAPSRYDLGESLLITTLLGIPLGEPDGKTPAIRLSVRGSKRDPRLKEIEGSLLLILSRI